MDGLAKVQGSIGAQVRSEWRTIAWVVVVTGVVVAGVVAVKYVEDVPFGDLARDTTAVLDGPAYTGLLSQIGLFGWAVVVGLSFFVAWVRRIRCGTDRVVCFLVAMGTVTTLVGTDDAFLVHEQFGGKGTFSVYMVVIAVWLIAFRSVVVRTPYLLLALALAFFAGSAVFDTLREDLSGVFRSYIVEDTFKLLGILTWIAYVARLGAAALSGDADDLRQIG